MRAPHQPRYPSHHSHHHTGHLGGIPMNVCPSTLLARDRDPSFSLYPNEARC